MKSIALILVVALNCAFANLHQAPPNLKSQSKNLIFVDIKTIDTFITYDVANSKAFAESKITFYQPTAGYMIFDLVANPVAAVLDGSHVSTGLTSMEGTSTVRFLNKATSAGNHTLVIKNEIINNIDFKTDHVRNGFWMSDLTDRKYMEQYLPTNLEYDQYKLTMDVKVLSDNDNQVLYTNGNVSELGLNHWKIYFPEVYTASSFYFHITEKGRIPEEKSTYRSIDNRIIPITVYTTQGTSTFMSRAKQVLAELEKDYGPFAHDKVVIYGSGSGGMEHCGATITSLRALAHELTHSYFARGVMPVHGNSGWVDEAIASWRDAGYSSPPWWMSASNMGAHSVYERTTDRDAYTQGKDFIAYLNKKVTDQNKAHFKVFLKEFFTTRVFVPFKTAEFKKAIEDFYGINLDEDFNKYILAKESAFKKATKLELKLPVAENPMHPKLSKKQLMDLL